MHEDRKPNVVADDLTVQYGLGIRDSSDAYLSSEDPRIRGCIKRRRKQQLAEFQGFQFLDENAVGICSFALILLQFYNFL